MAQFKHFSGLRTYEFPLQRDLRELERWISSTDARLARLTGGEAINEAQTGQNISSIGPHAFTHATDGGGTETDPITPYGFVWEGQHRFYPTSNIVPVKIKAAVATPELSPNDLGTSPPRIWHRVDSLVNVVANNTPVPNGQQWADLSPNGTFLAAAASGGLTMRYNQIAGHAALENVTGVIGECTIGVQGTGAGTPPSGSAGIVLANNAGAGTTYYAFTGAFVFRYGTTAADSVLSGRGLGVQERTGFNAQQQGQPLRVNYGDAIGNSVLEVSANLTAAQAAPGSWHYVIYRGTQGASGVVDVMLDGVDVTLGTPTFATMRSFVAGKLLGTGSGGLELSAGPGTMIAEQIIWGVRLSDAERLVLSNYFANRYALSAVGATGTDMTEWFDVGGTQVATVDFGGKFGIGTGLAPTSRLHVRDTSSPQFKLEYNASNHMTVSASNTGVITFDATGSGASFIFLDPVTFSGVPGATAPFIISGTTTPQFRIQNTTSANELAISVSTAGAITYDATGASAGHTFLDQFTVETTTTPQVRLGRSISGNTYITLTVDAAGLATWASAAANNIVFTPETTHNGGIDMGTSGRFDSNTATSTPSFRFRATTAQANGEQFFLIEDAIAGAHILSCAMTDNTDGETSTVNMGSIGSVVTTGNTLFVGGQTKNHTGFQFNQTFRSAGTAVSNALSLWTNCATTVNARNAGSSGATYIQQLGHHVDIVRQSSVTGAGARIAGVNTVFTNFGGAGATMDDIADINCNGISAPSLKDMVTIGDACALRIRAYNYNPTMTGSITRKHGIRIAEMNTDTDLLRAYDAELFIEGAGGAFFRGATPTADENSISSVTASHLDIKGFTHIDFNVGSPTTEQVNIQSGLMTFKDGFDIVVGSTTGTKIATATTQKLGFYNATPIVQPANTVAINDVLVNLGLRASGGSSNFSSSVVAASGLDVSAANIVTDTVTGTRIGTSTTQLLGFYNAAPVARPSAYTQTYVTTGGKVNANLTSATLTDSTGGTANTTLVDVGAVPLQANINDNFADVVVQINALRADLENVKQLSNSIIDDLQTLGLVA